MANHSRVAQVLQAGVEVTEGTAVAATKRFPGLMLDLNPDGNFNKYRPSGSKWTTIVIQGKEWTTGPISGPIGYGEIVYLLSSVVNYAAPNTVGGVTTWTHEPAVSTPDTSKSYTFEFGDSNSGYQVAGCYVNELGLKFTRESAEYSGTMMGRRTNINAISGGTTMIENFPVAASLIDVYYSTTSLADLTSETNHFTDQAFESEFKLGKRFSPFWPLNSALTSFGGRVEDVPDATFSLKLRADTSGSEFIVPVTLAKMRAGTTIWFRIKCTGPTLGASTYLLTIDVAVKVVKPYKFTDIDGSLVGLTWDFEIVDDGVAGKPFSIKVQNATTAL